MARTAPSLTESMKPGLRLQNFTCFLMRDPFIWSQSCGSLDELAIAHLAHRQPFDGVDL